MMQEASRFTNHFFSDCELPCEPDPPWEFSEPDDGCESDEAGCVVSFGCGFFEGHSVILLLHSSLLGVGRVYGISSLLFSIISPQKILYTENQQCHYAECEGKQRSPVSSPRPFIPPPRDLLS